MMGTTNKISISGKMVLRMLIKTLRKSVVIFLSMMFIMMLAPLLRNQISSARDYDVITGQNGVIQCTEERRDFVYVKMIKCASETLASVFRRFGYHRNLEFVLPVAKRIYVGWPFQIQSDMYRHTNSNMFNILTDHAIYNKTTLKTIMNPGTVYITSIREPFQQFISMFNYYKLGRITGIPDSSRSTSVHNNRTLLDPVTEYLHNLTFYEQRYTAKGAKYRHCIPDGLHMSRNLMSFNLGFPLGFPPGSPDLSHDPQAVSDWLRELDQDFLLVLIVERIDESLVLLKRLMCWELKDVLYQKKNSGKYTKTNKINQENYEIYRKWSPLDFQLYDHFTKVFERKVQAQGPDFSQEVQHFKQLNSKITNFCDTAGKYKSVTSLEVGESPWNKRFTYTTLDCQLLWKQLSPEVKSVQEKKYPTVIQPKPKIQTC